MLLDTFFSNFYLFGNSPDNIPKLRQLILQLAVRGKLVPQDPNDEPASVLLVKIKAEKEKLVKEGKLKQTGEIQQIEISDKPYELPQSWRWVHLINYGIIIMGQSPSSRYYNSKGQGLPFYQGKADYGKLYPTPTKWCEKPTKIAEKNDILISVRAPVGPTNICPEQSCIGRGLAALRSLANGNIFYLLYAIRAIEREIAQQGVGSTFTAISKKNLSSLLLPIPPLGEQHRIVEKVDSLMKLCDELEEKQKKQRTTRISLNTAALDSMLSAKSKPAFKNGWSRIRDNFELLYDTPETVDKLRQSILQLAVQGKLVPQDPKDEPASVLLEKIKAEKEKLVKEGKIRKTKPLPPIDSSKIPYELPRGWEWSWLEQLSVNIHYGYNASADFSQKAVRLLRISDIQNNKVNWETVPGCKIEENNIQSYLLNNNDILIARTGGTIGKSYIVKELAVKAVFASYLIRVIPAENVSPTYLKLFFESPSYWSQLYAKSMGTGQPNVNGTSLKSLLIPLPPIYEQNRIVDKVDSLKHLCAGLEIKLKQSQSDCQTLMTAMIDKILQN